MNVPSDLVENRKERVDGDEPHSRLDQAAGHQAALAESIASVTIANGRRLFRQLEGRACLIARHDAKGRVEVALEQLFVLTLLETVDRLFDDRPQLSPPGKAHFADLLGRQQVGNLEIRLRGIGVEHERIVGLSQKARVLPVRHVPARGPHDLGKNHVRRQVAAPSAEIAQHATGMRRIDPARKEPPGLHHLVARVVDGGRRVIATSHD